MIKNKVNNPKSFDWLSQMRFYFDPKQNDVLQQLSVHMANAKFNYGFEYLGVQEKLVQTPLTDRCYLTMTQALETRLGGSPFGIASSSFELRARMSRFFNLCVSSRLQVRRAPARPKL